MYKNICYICGSTDALQEHHIIPRASGGEDGPTVFLCANDHQKVHQQALAFEAKKSDIMFPPNQWKRAKKIVGYIQLAIRQNKNNPNLQNPATLMIKLTKYELSLLHLIKQDAGYTNLSIYLADILRKLIKSRFPRA